MKRVFFTFVFSLFLCGIAWGQSSLEGSWQATNNKMYLRVEAVGGNAFVVTRYKRSPWDSKLDKEEFVSMLNGSVLLVGKTGLIYRPKSDQLLFGQHGNFNRIDEIKLDALYESDQAKRNHKAAKEKPDRDMDTKCMTEYLKALQSGSGGLSQSCINHMKN